MAKPKPKKNVKHVVPITIKMCDVYVRQIPTEEYNSDKYYFEELDKILDLLFEIANDREWSWARLALESGLAYGTIVNLGERWTKRPQFRTVLLLARAVDYQLITQKRKGDKPALRLVSAG